MFSHSNFSFSCLRVFCGVAGRATMAGRTNCSQLQIPFCWCQLPKRRLSLNRFLQNFSSIFLAMAGFFYIFRFILPWDSFMRLNWVRFCQLVFFRDFKLPRRRLSPHRFIQNISSNFLSVSWFFSVFRFILPWDSFMSFKWISFCQFVCFRFLKPWIWLGFIHFLLLLEICCKHVQFHLDFLCVLIMVTLMSTIVYSTRCTET